MTPQRLTRLPCDRAEVFLRIPLGSNHGRPLRLNASMSRVLNAFFGKALRDALVRVNRSKDNSSSRRSADSRHASASLLKLRPRVSAERLSRS